jgi:addiction module HigA family antidote
MARTKRKKLPPVHPGEVLREELLKPLGLSANQLAIALRVPSGRIVEILNEKRSISADTALRLSRYFGMSAEIWMNMQADYDLAKARDELAEAIAHDVRPRAA